MNKFLKILGFSEDENNDKVVTKDNNNESSAINDNSQLEDDLALMSKVNNMKTDECFVYNFTKHGGFFVFCLNKNEIKDIVEDILKENNWTSPLINENELLNISGITSSDFTNADVFISTCDNLIADNGKIMVSSHQSKHHTFKSLPKNHIIIATPNQIVESTSDGLSKINQQYRKDLPTKITTICTNADNAEDGFGVLRKIYLVLLEDYS